MHGKLNETNVWVLEKNKPAAELRCSVAYFLFFSVFQICGDDNLSKLKFRQHGYRNNFRFPFSSLLTR